MDWKRKLNFTQGDILGLDIGSSSVKMVQLQRQHKQFAVTDVALMDIPNETTTDEDVDLNTVNAINNCLQLTEVQTDLAVSSVCGPEVAVRAFKFPSLQPDEIDGAVLFEAEQVCPFNLSEATIDYQLIPNGQHDTKGVLVAATNQLIESRTRLVEDASLRNVMMDVDGLALLNCFGECEKEYIGRTTAILNVGNTYTNLVIIGKNGLPFIRDITCAGKNIIDTIADENNLSAKTISEILFGSNNHDQQDSQPDLENSLAIACRKLVTEVIETLRYYSTQEKTYFVEKIFVCGGFALVKGFVGILDSQLPAPTVLWNPFEKIAHDPNQQYSDILTEKGPAMAVAAGLAMRAI